MSWGCPRPKVGRVVLGQKDSPLWRLRVRVCRQKDTRPSLERRAAQEALPIKYLVNPKGYDKPKFVELLDRLIKFAGNKKDRIFTHP